MTAAPLAFFSMVICSVPDQSGILVGKRALIAAIKPRGMYIYRTARVGDTWGVAWVLGVGVGKPVPIAVSLQIQGLPFHH